MEVVRSVASTLGHGEAMRKLADALGGHAPFPWQRALLDRFLYGQVPRALDLPTGLGKTSVIAIWLIARAAGALVPRRLVYVVDRRSVVDQATTEAERLREFVELDEGLKRSLGLERRALPISTLRGRYADNRAWLEDPAVPAIILGTVDMIGSRLLFEGYGVSWKMRPYHAGLLGSDSLFVLDEAHLVPPFERLLEAVSSQQTHDLGPAPELVGAIPPVLLLSLSATGRALDDALILGEEDRADPVIKQRIHARKILDLRPPVAKGDLAARLAEEAIGLEARKGEPHRVLIFCDTREDAVKVAGVLGKRSGKMDATPSIGLFVGARRVYERTGLAQWLQDHGFIAGSGLPPRSAFLVATSAAEVGVDLDADAAVMDVVAWERMVQRLGRVNRRGQGSAPVVVVPIHGDERSPELRAACLALLGKLPSSGGGIDGSPAALDRVRSRAGADPELAHLLFRATTPAPLHPPLTRALVDAWAMTSLEEHAGRPEVKPWLRGWGEDDDPQTTVVFRTHLPLVDGRPFEAKALESFLEAAGPHALECLETETSAVLDWLSTRVDTVARHMEAKGMADSNPWGLVVARQRDACPVTRATLSDKKARGRLGRLLAGATLVVDARLGGLANGLLDEGASPTDEPLDLTQIEELPFRVRTVDRLEETSSDEYRMEKAFVVRQDQEGRPSSWLLVERRRDEAAVSEAGRSVAARAQPLEEHQSWVESEALSLGARLGLPSVLGKALQIAARLHDEGKRSDRWQRAFKVPVGQRPLAKSTRAPSIPLLGGYRHELGSLLRMERDFGFLGLDQEARDLALHLVAAHHGRARPIIPADGADEPPTIARERAQAVALRFDRLSRRYGPWGLAWLESLLRAADQMASRRNDEEAKGG